MHPALGAAVAVLTAAFFASTRLPTLIQGRYDRPTDVRWYCEPPILTVLPLGLPTARWSATGKIMGTQSTSAVTYNVLDVRGEARLEGADAVYDLHSGDWQTCDHALRCTLAAAWGARLMSATPVEIGRLRGPATVTLDVPRPLLTPAFSVTDVIGMDAIVFRGSTQLGGAGGQIVNVTLDNLPDTDSYTAVGPTIDLSETLDVVRLTPRFVKDVPLRVHNGPLYRGLNPTFVMTETRCVESGGPLVALQNVRLLARVGVPQTCTTYLLSVQGPVDACLALDTGRVVCRACTLAACLSSS